MADTKKPDLNLDDWDSIPLDPAADDWDDPPAAAPFAPPSAAPLAEPVAAGPPVQVPEPAGEAQPAPEPEIVIDFDMPEPLDAFSEPDDEPDSLEEAAATTDFGSLLTDFEAPDTPLDNTFGPAAPVVDSVETIDPFEQIEIEASPAEPEPAPLPFSADSPKFSQFDAGEPEEPEELEEDYDAHLGPAAIDEAFAAIKGPAAPPPEMREADLNFEDLTTKKVELDIDGIFLESAEEEPPPVEELEPEPETPAPPEPEPKVETPPEPLTKRIPRVKLLLIALPTLAAALGLVFGVYKLFFSSKEDPGAAREQVIDPRVPPRDPQPGEMPLEAFYISFPGSQGDTLVEMTVVLYYNDFPDQAAVGEQLATVRDLIFRAAQGKGSQVISDGEMQKALREELAANINLALGREAVSYVQITQIRILH